MPATIDRLLDSTLLARTDTGAKVALASAVQPARRDLQGAAAAAVLEAAATATAFYAIATVAQDVLSGHTSWPQEWPWLLLLAVVAAIRSASSYKASMLALHGALKAERGLHKQLLAHALGRGDTTLTSAAQATAIIDEVERVGAYVERYAPARTAAALVPAVLLGAVFPASWLVGVLLVFCLPLPAVNLSIVGMGTAGVARQRAAELRHLAGYFLDRLRGLATLRALGAEQAELARVKVASDRLQVSSMAVLRVAFVSAAVLEAIVTVAVAVIASYIGLTLLGYVHIPGLPTQMSLRDGLFLLMVTPLYFQPVRNLAAAYHERAEAFAAIEALAPLLSDSQASHVANVSPVQVERPPTVLLRDVDVKFDGREAPALDGVTLSVQAGELIGVSGPSGAGKSTLLRLVAGDLAPSEGSVTIDEAPAVDVERTSVTWLGQRPYLFSGTLADNIRLGRQDASVDAIRVAALNAGLDAVLDRLGEGLETRVGEGGWGLSGGETHRISLARTFLNPSSLLLLDEPTAHLDAESELAIIETITELARGATTIVVTHSPALLAICDRVLALDRGRLVERGVTAALSGSSA